MNPILLADHLRIANQAAISGRPRATGLDLCGAALTAAAAGICVVVALALAGG